MCNIWSKEIIPCRSWFCRQEFIVKNMYLSKFLIMLFGYRFYKLLETQRGCRPLEALQCAVRITLITVPYYPFIFIFVILGNSKVCYFEHTKWEKELIFFPMGGTFHPVYVISAHTASRVYWVVIDLRLRKTAEVSCANHTFLLNWLFFEEPISFSSGLPRA